MFSKVLCLVLPESRLWINEFIIFPALCGPFPSWKELRETHDSFIFTTLRIQHKNKNLFFNLNEGATTNKHPFNSSILRPKMVHMKGHNKKAKMGKFLKRHKVDI